MKGLLDTTIVYTPQQNGIVECMNETLLERARRMISVKFHYEISKVLLSFPNEIFRQTSYKHIVVDEICLWKIHNDLYIK